MTNFRRLVLKKALRLFSRRKTDNKTREWSKALKRAWRWYYKKVATKIKKQFKFTIQGDEVETIKHKGTIVEYLLSKKDGFYLLEVWQGTALNIYQKLFVKKRANLIPAFLYASNRLGTEIFFFEDDFFPKRL